MRKFFHSTKFDYHHPPQSQSPSQSQSQSQSQSNIPISPNYSHSNSNPSHSPSQSSQSSHSSSSLSSPSGPGLFLSASSFTLIITIFLSALLTLLNKSTYTTFDFPFPFYLLALHFASISITSRYLAKQFKPIEFENFHREINWEFWFKNVLFVGLSYGSAILCSNLAYLILSVSFVQMLKAFTPVILVITTALLDHRLPPLRTVLVVLSISTGVAIAAYGEIHFVILGVFFQLLGSLAEVSRLIATQKLLQDLNVDPLVALSALSPICFAMAITLAPIFEAIALNVVVLFLVSSTNALVLTLTGIVKDICLIFGSVIFLGSHVTHTQILGYALAALGLVYFKCTIPSSQNRHHRQSTSSSSPMIGLGVIKPNDEHETYQISTHHIGSIEEQDSVIFK
ncbi:hypothetical protein O181_019304 [Austropuccinia psidii MF-1]|uniref:Sugar phosphate transporter domain-containing protein n=1 Tax=Austropuccinia psidii MF-1 TaxID=1389203 RepID=A0A9Q3GUL3_9BASI|nr:hypothetical protein [Austropuccinia psidii MF-1]